MAYTTIDDPSKYFQTTLYTGNATDDTAYTNGGNSNLQADWLWVKNREVTVDNVVFDSTRGVTKNVRPNINNQESTNSNYLKSFDSDGFTMGTSNRVNGNTNNMIAWQWKANGGSRTTNTESGNNPAGGYQASTTSGFSIIDYVGTGAAGTMAHGLGAVPTTIIVKNRDEGEDWAVYHRNASSAGNDSYLELNTSDAVATAGTVWNDTTPTSSVFTIGSNNKTNKDTINYIAYAFTPIQGFSKFGSYTGNGNADGPFVYTGFKPAFLLKKGTGSGDWHISDNKQNSSNAHDNALRPNENNATETGNTVDFLSNGFKIRNTGGSWNSDGNSYVYAAFAHHPFVSSEGVPTTAR